MTDVDAIVVGAGPAGAAMTIRSLAQGARVLLVERQPWPRERVGETLHPGVEGPLRELTVLERVNEAGFLRHLGVWRAEGERMQFAAYGEDASGRWRGYQAWRAHFDALLVERACELGGRLLRTRAQRPVLERGRVVGVETSRGVVRSPVVVDAAGGGHWLARHLGLSVERRSPRLVAAYGYAWGHAEIAADAPVFTAHGSGWEWTARVSPGTYQWTTLDTDPRRPLRRGSPAQLASLRQGRVRSADVTWRRVGRSAGPGYVLVGDAAAVVDPAASHGVLRALLGGLAAADVVAAGGSNAAEEVEAKYDAWLRWGFENDVLELRQLYSQLPSPPSWVLDGRPEHHPGRRAVAAAPA